MLLPWLALSCFLGSTQAKEPRGQSLIVLLVDGLGASLLNNTKAETTIGIRQLIENGVQAEHVIPSFPTQTYPNWLSLTTGLYTENHGFTADYIWDQKSGLTFERGIGANDTEDIWWKDRPAPIWYTIGKNDIDVHCYWFAHCHRAHYDLVVQVPMKRWADMANPQQTSNIQEIYPEIVKRITKYQAYKQQTYLIRYAGIDTALRQFGAASDEAEQAIAQADSHILKLQETLEQNGLFTSVNLIVVSTHGLAPVPDDVIYVEDCLSDFAKVKKVVNSHSLLMIFTEPADEGKVYHELRICEEWAPDRDYEDDSLTVRVFKMSEIPEDLHWKHSPHMSGVVLITKPGTTVITRGLPSIPDADSAAIKEKFTSGWNPSSPDMKGVFLARGPAFKVSEKHPAINVVDVYQIMLNILGVDAGHPNNGTWSSVEAMLTDGWEDRPNSEKVNSGSCLGTFIALWIPVFVKWLF